MDADDMMLMMILFSGEPGKYYKCLLVLRQTARFKPDLLRDTEIEMFKKLIL